MLKDKALIFIPTYNEAENVGRIFLQIRQLNLTTHILFLDDNSPDGTGKIIDDIIAAHEDVSVIHRKEKSGVGSAHKEGLRWAYENDYEILVTMDCDFTHSPEYILDFIRNSYAADIVVGSRYLKKDSLATWNLFRKSLTHFGHFLTVNMLKMPYDASGAFRLYNLKNIDKNIFFLIRSSGYSFFFESLFILNLNKKRIFEIPIELPSRTYGTSKMTWTDAWASLRFLMNLYVRKQLDRKSLIHHN
jgi:dolichol-phosphate mannosyltransferase